MSDRDDLTKIAAQCRCCGKVYAAERWPDGTVRPIGRRAGCECGSTEFRVVGDSHDRNAFSSFPAD